MPSPSRDIDERLADLDRRLQEIQEELLPDREPRPVATSIHAVADTDAEAEGPPPWPPGPPPPHRRPPGPPPPPGPPHSTSALTELHAKLLGSFRELLDAYEWLLTQTAQHPAPPPPAAPAPPGAVSPSLTTGVTAGPFANTDAVRAFEAALGSVPGVRSVSVRGYEGDDRAIFDVEIGEP